jgi:hypothetical protein
VPSLADRYQRDRLYTPERKDGVVCGDKDIALAAPHHRAAFLQHVTHPTHIQDSRDNAATRRWNFHNPESSRLLGRIARPSVASAPSRATTRTACGAACNACDTGSRAQGTARARTMYVFVVGVGQSQRTTFNLGLFLTFGGNVACFHSESLHIVYGIWMNCSELEP